jgi:hypothetical protein
MNYLDTTLEGTGIPVWRVIDPDFDEDRDVYEELQRYDALQRWLDAVTQ